MKNPPLFFRNFSRVQRLLKLREKFALCESTRVENKGSGIKSDGIMAARYLRDVVDLFGRFHMCCRVWM